MKLNEAIEVLKDAKYIGSDEYASDYDREMNEAIDTVVDELEQVLPKDYKCPCCGSDKVYLTAAAHCGLCATTTEI